MKLQVKAIVAKFSTQSEVDHFYIHQLNKYPYLIFVSFQVIEQNGSFYATICFAEEYSAAISVLSQKSYADLRLLAKQAKVKTTKVKPTKSPRNKRDIQKAVASGEIENNFVKHNINNLFEKGKSNYRKRVFDEKGIQFYKTTMKEALLTKTELLEEIMMVADTKEFAFEIALFIY